MLPSYAHAVLASGTVVFDLIGPAALHLGATEPACALPIRPAYQIAFTRLPVVVPAPFAQIFSLL